MTDSQKNRLNKQLSDYAGKYVRITYCVQSTHYALTDELSMFRIAEKMRSMSNFSYGYSKNLESHFISITIED